MDPKRALAKAQAAIDGFHDVMGVPISRGELLYMLCVAEHETRCGDAWPNSHNWGAIQWRRPTADEMVRIKAGDLKSGDTIPGGVLHGDSGPGQGGYWVWFRAFVSERAGAACLVATLYKGNPEARAAAQAGGPTEAFCTGMYRHGYYEGVHPTAKEKAEGMALPRPAFGPKGLMRTLPLQPAEAENVGDYCHSVDRLMPEWVAALETLPLVSS